MIDYDPAQHFNLNTRDQIALHCFVPNAVFGCPEVIARLAGVDAAGLLLERDVPIAIARWQYLYADAVMKARRE